MNWVSKKWLASLSVVSLMGVFLAGCATSTSAPKDNSSNPPKEQNNSTAAANAKVLRVGLGLNEQSTEYKGTVKFKELVEKYSNGSVKVEIYPSGQLGADLNMMQQLQSGALECTIPATSPMANIVPDFSVFEFPFLFKDDKSADSILDGPAGQGLLDMLKPKGLVGLAYWELGFRDVTNSKHPIKTLEDLKGIKLRVMQNNVLIDFWNALGANPTPMSFDQVFNALQQGVIDGQENPVQTVYTQKFYDAQKYLTMTHHVYTPFVVLISKVWWDGLTPDQQQEVKKAAIEAGKYQRQINRDEAKSDLDALKQKGMEINTISDQTRSEMQQKSQPVIDKYSAQYGDGAKKILDEIKKVDSK